MGMTLSGGHYNGQTSDSNKNERDTAAMLEYQKWVDYFVVKEVFKEQILQDAVYSLFNRYSIDLGIFFCMNVWCMFSPDSMLWTV